MKMAIKRENNMLLVIALIHVSGLTVIVNLLGTPKSRVVAHEMVIKLENYEFLVMSLKHVSSLTGHANIPGAPKLWAIAQENGGKTRKRRVFGHNSQTCIGSYGHCKSP